LSFFHLRSLGHKSLFYITFSYFVCFEFFFLLSFFLFQCLIDQQNCSLHLPNSDEILCSEPLVLNETRISHLNQSEIPVECPPKLVSVNEPNVTIHKKIGDRHQFQCRALGIPTPKIHWILPNGDILNDTSNTIHFQLKTTGSLRMFHLKPRDSGIYQCVAENIFGSVMSTMKLSIDNIDLHLFPISVSSTYVTLVSEILVEFCS
jgi:hypothetical protein